jgi:hypothetical protein
VLLILGVVAACAIGWVASRGGIGSPGTEPAAAAGPAITSADTSPTAAPTASPAAGSPEALSGPVAWQRVIDELYRRRAQAFRTGSGALLGDVYTADSPQMTADEEGLTELLAGDRVVHDFAPRVDRVSAVAVSGDRATVTLVDSWPAYTVVDGGGRVVSRIAARAPTGVRMVLLRTAAGWRIDSAGRTR